MTATPTPTLEGTQSLNQIELFWDRYRSIFWILAAVIAGAIGINYGIKYFNQKKVDSAWSSFAASVGADVAYTDFAKQGQALTESVGAVDLPRLEAALASSSPAQKPFLLLAISR